MARTKSSLPTLSWLAAILLLLLAVSTCVEAQSGPIIGIDLGSTHSSVGVYHESRNETRIHTIPSYVAFTQAGTCLVGQAAKNQSILNPSNTIFDTKRLIGRNFQDTDVQENLQRWPFILIDRDGKPAIQVKVNGQDKIFRPEEVVARILQELKEWSEAYLGQKVTSAVIAVPAYFNDAQRQATKDAGTIAGLTVERIVNEPTAAAIAYGLDTKGGEQNILVYDLGGGTFDVSLSTIEEGVFEVLATSGDTHLGGMDFDNRVIEHFIRLWKKKTGKDCVEDLQAMVKLTQKVEEAKRVLSSEMSVHVEIESFHDGQDFSEVLTRAKFEELNMDLFEKTLQFVKKVVKDAGLSTHEIHEILLVGRSSRIPKVVELVESYFDGKKVLKQDGHPDEEAVVHGAAIQGRVLSRELSLCGCGCGGMSMFDLLPASLGIKTPGGIMTKVIRRNTVLPHTESRIISTTHDNQTTVVVQVYRGERPLTRDNTLLGSLEVNGISPSRRGVPQIEVTLAVDANEILTASAVDLSTGRIGSRIFEMRQFSDEDVYRLIMDAEDHAEEDQAVRELIEQTLEFDSYVYGLKNFLADLRQGGKLSPKTQKTFQDAIERARDWLDSFDASSTAREDLGKHKSELEATVAQLGISEGVHKEVHDHDEL